MTNARLVFTLPGSGLAPLIIEEGGPIARRSQEGTYQDIGRNSSGVPEFSNQAIKAFTWRIGAFVPIAKERLLQDYLYFQDEGDLGNIIIDDLDRPIRPLWLNWGNRTEIDPLPSGVTAPSDGSKYFRTFCVLTIEPESEFSERGGFSDTAGQLMRVAFTAIEVPA